jgi:hypothetical protein
MNIKMVLKLIWLIIPKDYLAEVVIELLQKATHETKAKWDDKLIDRIQDIYYTLKSKNKQLK